MGMAAAEERDGRNFRQTYYEKVGFKGVEEKRSLEMILNERPLDVNRLTQFTCRFNLPDVHRERVWLLLLGEDIAICVHPVSYPISFIFARQDVRRPGNQVCSLRMSSAG